jgi:hypothetical protein
MALMKCSECGGKQATSAPACPHCGHVRAAASFVTANDSGSQMVIVVAVSIVVIAVIAGIWMAIKG